MADVFICAKCKSRVAIYDTACGSCGEKFNEPGATPPSPRASSELPQPYWNATGKCTRCGAQGNGYQACGNCFGLAVRQQQEAMAAYNQRQNQNQKQVGSHYGTRVEKFDPVDSERRCALALLETQQALAASEKERERLKAELDKPATCDHCPRRAKHFTCSECGVMMGDTVPAERDAVRRELENLKRETDMKLGDYRAGVELLTEAGCDKQTRVAWLERELDRERAKTRKRGL